MSSRMRPLAPLLCALVAVFIGVSALIGASPAAADPASAATFGLLGPTSSQLDAIASSNITRVSLASGWDQVEPQRNVFNPDALSWLRGRVDALRSAGKEVVLDLGLQYPPSWVFSLGGETRFVNQYGDAWHGPLSEDVPNAVFNSRIRAAEADYISALATALGPDNIASVRVGGLLSGELRYPPNTYNGHTNSLWLYDPSAQANAPVPGWRPGGIGSTSDIQASLSYYFASLTRYETWLMKAVAASFPGVNQQVMLPGWGIRPGMVDAAVQSGMQGNTVAEVNGMIASGLDWDNQVKAIKTARVNGTVYTTWLDAPTQADTPQGQAPVDYLATLARRSGLPIAGENTGTGGAQSLQLCLDRVRADNLTGMMYMSGDLIAAGTAGVSINDLTGAATQLMSG